MALMQYRLKQSGLPFQAGAPYLPSCLSRVLKRQDPMTMTIVHPEKEIPLPLKQKHILVLSGAEDRLVPWVVSKNFITALQSESTNIQVHLYDGVRHEFTTEMRKEFHNWLQQFI
jgi:predicted esterase